MDANEKRMLIVPPGYQKRESRKFYATQYVTALPEGEFQDWPSQMQDAVMEALNQLSLKHKLPLKLVGTQCDIDYGEAVDKSQDRPFVRIFAEEIIDDDIRYDESKVRAALQQGH